MKKWLSLIYYCFKGQSVVQWYFLFQIIWKMTRNFALKISTRFPYLTCHLNIRRLDDETKLQYMHSKWQMLLLIAHSIQRQYGLWICKRRRDNEWQKSLFKDFCRLKLYFSYQCRIRLPLALSVLFKSFCACYHRRLW